MAVDYSQSEKDRERIIRERQKATAKAFERMRARIDDQISNMNMSTVSERAKRQQLEEIRDQLQKSLGAYYGNLEDGLKSDMISIGQSVLSDSEAFYNSLNMPISMAITSFPVEIMENVINGSVYNEKWFLSGALWGDYQSKLNDINEIVMQGIGMNLSSLEIAKQLEQFVDPSAMKPSSAIVTPCLQDPNTGKLYSMDYVKRHPEKDWSGFKEKKSRFYYGKVDYNAQRLARTLVSHAYQQNVVRQAQANPFATGVKWEASGGERMCEICEERDGKIFPVDDVPLDHPNGMCTFTVETPSMMEMSDALADWVNGEPTDWDDQLNAYYEGMPIEHKSTANASGKEEIARRIVEGRDITGEWERRRDQFDFEIEDVINAQGFDGLPRVVSAEEFDRLVKEANDGNGFIAQRTYSAGDQETLDAYRDMLYNGKWYVDCGTGGAQYGQGMYCAADYNGQLTDGIKIEMQHYKELGEGRFTFQSRHQEVSDLRTREADAAYNKIVNQAGFNGIEKLIFKVEKENKGTPEEIDRVFDLMSNMNREERRSLLSRLNEVYSTATELRKSIFDISIEDYAKQKGIDLYYKPLSYTETFTLDPSAKVISYSDLVSEFNSYKSGIAEKVLFEGYESISNIGAFAVARGYDAINAEGHGESGSYTVILNRTKLIIKEP